MNPMLGRMPLAIPDQLDMAILSWAAQAFGAPVVALVVVLLLALAWYWSRR